MVRIQDELCVSFAFALVRARRPCVAIKVGKVYCWLPFLCPGLPCFPHPPREALAHVDGHEAQGCQLTPLVHVDNLGDQAPVVLMDEVDAVRAHLQEGRDGGTGDEVLLVAEQGWAGSRR